MARNITGDTILLGASAHGVWSICYPKPGFLQCPTKFEVFFSKNQKLIQSKYHTTNIVILPPTVNTSASTHMFMQQRFTKCGSRQLLTRVCQTKGEGIRLI